MQDIPETGLMNDFLHAQAYAESDFEQPRFMVIRLFQEMFPYSPKG